MDLKGLEERVARVEKGSAEQARRLAVWRAQVMAGEADLTPEELELLQKKHGGA